MCTYQFQTEYFEISIQITILFAKLPKFNSKLLPCCVCSMRVVVEHLIANAGSYHSLFQLYIVRYCCVYMYEVCFYDLVE